MQNITDKDILFLINPNSGNKSGLQISKELQSDFPEISQILTKSSRELELAFAEYIEKYEAFIVVGGDGTINEALKNVVGRNDKLFGVLPAGSGNGFSREVGFGKSLKSLVEDAKNGDSVLIDILNVNGDYCINVTGIGIDSYVAHRFQNSKGRGLKNYIRTTINAVFTFKPFHAKIEIDNTKIEDKFMLITIANTRQFGNNAFISPKSKPNDGVFELVLAKPFPFYLYPVFVIKLFRGTLRDSKYVKYISVKDKMEITSDFMEYHIDGEPKLSVGKLYVEILNQKVRIIKTKNCKFK